MILREVLINQKNSYGESNKMKIIRTISFLAALLACGITSQSDAQEKHEFVAVCSTTQIADFIRQVGGDRWEVVSLLAAEQDPHTYEIKSSDSQAVGRADLCFENGWHLEGKDWMKSLAEGAGKPLVTCVTGIKPLEIEEGDVEVRDPHAWFTPLNAATYVRNIVAGLSDIDPDHKGEYEARANLYLNQLRTLHLWIERELSRIPKEHRVLVTSHDAYGYFCREYGFAAHAPSGWSTGSEVGAGVTPERRKIVVQSIREFGVPAIFVETSVNEKLIQEIAKEAGVKVGGELYSDAMGPPGSAGETYIGMMRENVITLVESLREHPSE